MSRPEDVYLHIYDLSKGLGHVFGKIAGVPIDAVYHTSIVVYGHEFSFANGIHRNRPGKSHHGEAESKRRLGRTSRSRTEFVLFLARLSRRRFARGNYDLLSNNCNHFSDELAWFLVKDQIPPKIRWLPELMSQSWLGQFEPLFRTTLKPTTEHPAPPFRKMLEPFLKQPLFARSPEQHNKLIKITKRALVCSPDTFGPGATAALADRCGGFDYMAIIVADYPGARPGTIVVDDYKHTYFAPTDGAGLARKLLTLLPQKSRLEATPISFSNSHDRHPPLSTRLIDPLLHIRGLHPGVQALRAIALTPSICYEPEESAVELDSISALFTLTPSLPPAAFAGVLELTRLAVLNACPFAEHFSNPDNFKQLELLLRAAVAVGPVAGPCLLPTLQLARNIFRNGSGLIGSDVPIVVLWAGPLGRLAGAVLKAELGEKEEREAVKVICAMAAVHSAGRQLQLGRRAGQSTLTAKAVVELARAATSGLRWAAREEDERMMVKLLKALAMLLYGLEMPPREAAFAVIEFQAGDTIMGAEMREQVREGLRQALYWTKGMGKRVEELVKVVGASL